MNTKIRSHKHKRGEEEDGEEEPYSENQEPFPAHPAFDPRVERLKIIATESVDGLYTQLAGNTSASPAMRNMQGKAKKAREMRAPDRIMIALVGRTGAGKTSVLNSITDTPGLARVVAGGESCTNVPTLYVDHHPLQSKDKPFAAGIRYHTPDDCSNMMQELLDNYNLYTFERDESWSIELENEYSQSAASALQTFRTLYCEQDEFADEEAAEQTLSDDYAAYHKTLHKKMVSWCREHLATTEGETGHSYRFREFDSVEELNEYVDKHTLPPEDFETSSSWPIIKRVDIGVQTSRVLKLVTIVDLAGLSDTHKVRIKATHEHMTKCNAMWYVASVDRVITDPDLENTVSQYAAHFPNTLAIVVSKIDGGIDNALAKKMRNAKEDVEQYFTLSKELKTLETKAFEMKVKTRRLKASRSSELCAHLAEVDDLEARINRINCERQSILVEARNRFLTRRLKEDKQKYLPPGLQLPVFCISNSQYSANKQVDGADKKTMDPAATGIPALREYILMLAAPAVWAEIKAYLEHPVAGFFYGANCWAQADHKASYSGLMQCVKDVQKHWNFIIDPVPGKVLALVTDDLIKTLRKDHGKSLDGALQAFEEICNWSAGSFQAFFRKDGKHYTKAVGSECWNQLFLQEQSESTFLPAWERVTPSIQHTIRCAIDQISKALGKLPKTLEQQPGSASLPADVFDGMFRAFIAGIAAALERRSKTYEHNLRNIKRDATVDQPTSYFTNAMVSVYEDHKRQGGTGCTQRWKNALHAHLTQPGAASPFAIATNELEKALTQAADSYVKGISADVQDVMDDISREMTGILDDGEETKEKAAARKALLDVLSGTMPRIKYIEDTVKVLDAGA